MKEIKIYKAQPIEDKKAESINIIIDKEIPNIEDMALDGRFSYNVARKIYKNQGEMIGNALYNSLPGGTIDELLIFLLEKKASFFKVRF